VLVRSSCKTLGRAVRFGVEGLVVGFIRVY
jgi:hypothetical protein